MANEPPPLHDLACNHAQQAAEKFLKALLQENGEPVPRTHDLESLYLLILPHEPSIHIPIRGLKFLSYFAVAYRYPGKKAKPRQSKAAIRWAERTRKEVRRCLKLRT